VIVVLIIIAFAVYYLRYVPASQQNYGVTTPPSDSTASIEADLNATDLNNLDTELLDIDKELAQ